VAKVIGSTEPGVSSGIITLSEEATCGDGIQEFGEQCDDGNTNNNDACTNFCLNNVCGDTFPYEGVEVCDDGNTLSCNPYPGCNADCSLVQACGNGIKECSEQCDDDNLFNSDGCSSICQIESGWDCIWDCIGEPSVCTEIELSCLDLVLYHKYDSNALDYSGNGHNGIAQGAILAGGKYGNAYRFDGIDDYIAVNDHDELDTNLAAITVSAWIYPESLPSDPSTIVGKWKRFGATNRAYKLSTQASVLFFSVEESGDASALTQTSGLLLNTWQHVAGTWDGETIRLYINGLETGTPVTLSGTSIYNSDHGLAVGRINAEEDYHYFNGKVDEVIIWDRTLSSAEITSSMNPLDCTISICGNGFVEPGEQCDDGNTLSCSPYPGCNADCSLVQACGNGIKECGEQCDDNNLLEGDGCSSSCKVEYCGDNRCNNGETCGSTNNAPRCKADCGTCGTGPGGGSFLPGTQISMSDDSTKNIEEIEIGDIVLSYDIENKEIVNGEVTALLSHIMPGYYVIDDSLEITATNQIWADNEWKYPRDLSIGDELINSNNEIDYVDSIEYMDKEVVVFNLLVPGTNNYFAGGVGVHNGLHTPDPGKLVIVKR